MLEMLLFTIRLIDSITKIGPLGVSVVRPNGGWKESSQDTTAKSDRKFENPLRKLKGYERNYKLKSGKGHYSCRFEKKNCLYIHSIYLRTLNTLMLLWNENSS